jgi:FKBP-type peptidyl-prolyl cis-trans isomerase
MPMRHLAIISAAVLSAVAVHGVGLAASEATPSASGHRATASGGAAASDNAEWHALGVLLSRQLGTFEPSDRELREVLAGISDGVRHPNAVQAAQAFVPQLQALQRTRAQALAQVEERNGEAYLRKVAALPNARTTASGLVFVQLKAGTGPSPKIGDQVRVQYTGHLTDGSVFDSSAQHGGAVNFPLGRVIPCWDEALQLMKVGGHARIACPAKLAYADRGAGDLIKPGATLDFDVQLLAILPPAPAAAVGPPQPAGPPHTAPATPAH